MQYRVEMSDLASLQYDKILDYLAFAKKNPQAVHNVMDDFDNTIAQLENNAEVYGFCNDERLRNLGFHKIHFSKHDYLFVYRIVNDKVIVEGLYHELQDYENAIR